MFLVGEDLFLSVSQVRAEDHAVLARDEDERSEHGRDKDDVCVLAVVRAPSRRRSDGPVGLFVLRENAQN